MKAVIMAGGEGRRLKSITGERPKPMVPLLGRPMMEHILLLLKSTASTRSARRLNTAQRTSCAISATAAPSACGSNTASSARRWARRAA